MFEIPGQSGRALPDLQQPLCAIGRALFDHLDEAFRPLDKVLLPTGEDESILI